MPDYVWICLNEPEYAWICLNLPEWFLFYISPFPYLFYNSFSTWTHGYLFERLQETRRNTRLFSWIDKIWFFLKQLEPFVFCFRLNIFISKISNSLLPFVVEGVGGGGGGGGCQSWYILLVFFFFLIKTYEEIM